MGGKRRSTYVREIAKKPDLVITFVRTFVIDFYDTFEIRIKMGNKNK